MLQLKYSKYIHHHKIGFSNNKNQLRSSPIVRIRLFLVRSGAASLYTLHHAGPRLTLTAPAARIYYPLIGRCNRTGPEMVSSCCRNRPFLLLNVMPFGNAVRRRSVCPVWRAITMARCSADAPERCAGWVGTHRLFIGV
jgi:hypothetical protein